MKGNKREVWLALTKEVEWSLCTFCKYDKGNCINTECKHPLRYRLPEQELYPGGDCWGFKPSYDVSLAADIVGAFLANGWECCVWWEEEGVLKIAEAWL